MRSSKFSNAREKELYQTDDKGEYAEINESIHLRIAQMSRNLYIKRYVTQTYWRSQLYTFYLGEFYAQNGDAWESNKYISHQEHTNLINAIERRNAEEAREFMIEHIRSTHQRRFKLACFCLSTRMRKHGLHVRRRFTRWMFSATLFEKKWFCIFMFLYFIIMVPFPLLLLHHLHSLALGNSAFCGGMDDTHGHYPRTYSRFLPGRHCSGKSTTSLTTSNSGRKEGYYHGYRIADHQPRPGSLLHGSRSFIS